jgi:hypothetical protein
MGLKLLWLGLTLIVATEWLTVPAAKLVGSVIMIIGLLLYLLDR